MRAIESSCSESKENKEFMQILSRLFFPENSVKKILYWENSVQENARQRKICTGKFCPE